MKRVLDENEDLKVRLYIGLWESYHRANSYKELEERYISELIESNKSLLGKKFGVFGEVIKDFYLANGIDASLEHNQESKKLSIKKRIINPNENIYVSFLLRVVDPAPQVLSKDENRNDTYYFDTKELKKIANECFGEIFQKNEQILLYRAVIKNIFQLDERDAIFFARDKAIVKFFAKTLNKGRRYNGILEETLVKLYVTLDGENKELELNSIFNRLMANELNLREIDNIKFHTTYIPLFLSSIKKIFTQDISDTDTLLGFCKYFFRRNYDKIIQMIVDEILSISAENGEHIKSFINFYDGADVTFGTKRIKKSEMLVNGEKCTFAHIVKLQNEKQKIENEIFENEGKILSIKDEVLKNEHLILYTERELSVLKKQATTTNEPQDGGATVERAKDSTKLTQSADELKIKNKILKTTIADIQLKIEDLKKELLPISQEESEIKKSMYMAIASFKI